MCFEYSHEKIRRLALTRTLNAPCMTGAHRSWSARYNVGEPLTSYQVICLSRMRRSTNNTPTFNRPDGACVKRVITYDRYDKNKLKGSCFYICSKLAWCA